ncbi:hypothetical protein MTR67_003182 [Solanum verrucosum]|uniref:CCHC-type domain-containing protein n=1 Tax=Solanum verrucosum TaxID=315347 RepID=A0AAF0PSD4_SOLVR|nr:hypothetical protein MTR67_003182 [Solanum verrucosum]
MSKFVSGVSDLVVKECRVAMLVHDMEELWRKKGLEMIMVIPLMCGKRHEGRCLAGMEGCVSCGKSGHKMRNCPRMKVKGREGKKVAPSGSDGNAPKKNRFYALQAICEQECPLDVTIRPTPRGWVHASWLCSIGPWPKFIPQNPNHAQPVRAVDQPTLCGRSLGDEAVETVS